MFPLPFRHYPENQHITHHHRRRRRRAIVTKSKRNRSILTHIFASHISQQDPQKNTHRTHANGFRRAPFTFNIYQMRVICSAIFCEYIGYSLCSRSRAEHPQSRSPQHI